MGVRRCLDVFFKLGGNVAVLVAVTMIAASQGGNMSILALVLGLSFSATAANSTKYFKNPIKDDRIEFYSCAVEGALYGVLENKPESVVCFGKLNGSAEKTEYIVFYNKSTRGTYYFEQISNEFTAGAGDQEAGVQEYTVKLRKLEKDLTPSKPARVGTWKVTTSWIYSEGGTLVKGKIPGQDKNVNWPLFSLSSIDEEVDQFRGELGR
jgi:hypothetical protein